MYELHLILYSSKRFLRFSTQITKLERFTDKSLEFTNKEHPKNHLNITEFINITIQVREKDSEDLQMKYPGTTIAIMRIAINHMEVKALFISI